MSAAVKRPGTVVPYTQQQLLDLQRCEQDPFFFIQNYIKVQHPTKGIQPFNLYPYQHRMINAFHNHRYVVGLTARQMGKTACSAAYLLWYAMYVPNSTILIVGNIYSAALEIMQRIQFAYENVPDQFRDAALEYNKGSIEFENRSRILSRATSGTAGRGLSVSFLYCDEFAFVMPNKQRDFYASIQPVLSTGGKWIVTSTPKNDEDIFAQIWKGAIKKTDDYGNPLPEDGPGSNGFFPIMVKWDEHPDRGEKWAAEQRAQLGVPKFRQEFECVTGRTAVDFMNPSEVVDHMTIEQAYRVLKMAA